MHKNAEKFKIAIKVLVDIDSCDMPDGINISFGCTLILIISFTIVSALPYAYRADSPIKTIIVPYQRNVISGHPYQFPKVMGEARHVLVPLNRDMVPNFNLNQGTGTGTAAAQRSMTMTMGSQNIGQSVNFVDGAYPVYYMPGNANGKFNGKISLLS